MPTSEASPAPAFAAQLERVLPRVLGQPGALPQDWQPEATTYDLKRHLPEEEFVARFTEVVREIDERKRHDPEELHALLAACGHPSDYARLGQPLSTVFEVYLQALTGAARVISFASRTAPFLALAQALQPDERRRLSLYTEGTLPGAAARSHLLEHVAFHEQHEGPIPPGTDGRLTVYVSEKAPSARTLAETSADFVCCPVDEGGVLLMRDTAQIDPTRVQLVRKRTVAALLASNARTELARIAEVPAEARPQNVDETRCLALLREHFPGAADGALFCTGLAAEAAVFTAAARVLDAALPVRLFHAQNGYGGTVQLIADLLAPEGIVSPVPLPVVVQGGDGQSPTLVDRFIEALQALQGAPACLFLETPTNPELQVHDFGKLIDALKAYASRWGVRVPVLVDTTLAPLYPLFAQPFARDWPFVLVKSGSKYLTGGKATLGVVLASEDPEARRIVELAKAYREEADSAAKDSQRAALAEGLRDLPGRMARTAASTRIVAERIREELRRHGHDVTLYAMTDEQVASGLASGMISFYLPAAPTTKGDLVDEFVDYLIEHAPEIVKSRVSYGQRGSDGARDPIYVINPQESTQGSLPAAVKAAQKRDNVQICRISVPGNGDIEGFLRVVADFFRLKYGAGEG